MSFQHKIIMKVLMKLLSSHMGLMATYIGPSVLKPCSNITRERRLQPQQISCSQKKEKMIY